MGRQQPLPGWRQGTVEARGRGVVDDPEEPRAPQGPPTLEDVLAYSLGHVGFLRWGVAVVFDYQVKRRSYKKSKKEYYCQPEIRSVEGLLDVIFTHGNGNQSKWRAATESSRRRGILHIAQL